MNVRLISTDRELQKLCAEVIEDLPGLQVALSVADTYNPEPAVDLCLWDFDASSPCLPPASAASRICLVNRSDLCAFYERQDGAGSSIALKPVTRAALAAFLTAAAGGAAGASLRTDRDELLQCLIQANLKIQEYDQERTNFLARAVHDFRAPLTALRGYCDLLIGELMGPLNKSQKEVLRRMQHSSARLARMASGMFDLSVGRRGGVGPELRRGDLRDCLEHAFHEVAPFADEKRIAITVNVDPCDEALYFEGRQIEQLLINLLDNACKFTPKGGTLMVRGYRFFWERRCGQPQIVIPKERRRRSSDRPNAYRVDVQDSGSPIPHDRLDRIFEEYVSYTGGADRDGAGLGLAICKIIARQHGGRIWAENHPSGPVFSFVLPFVPPRPLCPADPSKTTVIAEAV
jgi:signal transduction histidine kinase